MYGYLAVLFYTLSIISLLEITIYEEAHMTIMIIHYFIHHLSFMICSVSTQCSFSVQCLINLTCIMLNTKQMCQRSMQWRTDCKWAWTLNLDPFKNKVVQLFYLLLCIYVWIHECVLKLVLTWVVQTFGEEIICKLHMNDRHVWGQVELSFVRRHQFAGSSSLLPRHRYHVHCYILNLEKWKDKSCRFKYCSVPFDAQTL